MTPPQGKTNPIISSTPKNPVNQKLLATILALGFVSGLPFLLTLSTLSYWLAEVGVTNTTIGLFMLVSLPYSFKFLWAPLLDHIRLPFLSAHLGNRKAWLLIMQIGLVFSLMTMSFTNPHKNILFTALAALGVSFFSASQDIIIDAYRIEMVQLREKGAAAALETIGFRFGMLASGAGALYLATIFDWETAYFIMAMAVGACLLITLSIKEPTLKLSVVPHSSSINNKEQSSLTTIRDRFRLYTTPFKEFAYKDQFFYILLFIFCFKLADTVLNAMSAPFLCDVGFSKLEFATVSKVFGISLMVMGGLVGGIIIHKMGIYQSAIMCAVLQSLSCLMFTIQAIIGYDCSVLMITVGVESFCSGLTSAIFIVFLSEFCCQPHTATHFTMLYSLGSLSRAITSAGAGWLADHLGWQFLFLFTSLIIFPTLFCLTKLTRVKSTLKNNPMQEVA